MGIITKVEVQKRNKNRVNIDIDYSYAFSVSVELAYKKALKEDVEVNEEDLAKLIKKDNFSKCKTAALKIVERSYKTEKEVHSKLYEKGYAADEVEYAVNFLKEYSFLNDELYANMYVKEKGRNQGKRRIKLALIQKGLSEEIILEALLTLHEDDESDNAYTQCRKKYNILVKREGDKMKLYNKLCRFLLSKGYNYDICKDVVKKVINED